MCHINGKEPGSRDAPHGETYEENGTSPDGPAGQEWVVCFGVPYSTSFANKVGPGMIRLEAGRTPSHLSTTTRQQILSFSRNPKIGMDSSDTVPAASL